MTLQARSNAGHILSGIIIGLMLSVSTRAAFATAVVADQIVMMVFLLSICGILIGLRYTFNQSTFVLSGIFLSGFAAGLINGFGIQGSFITSGLAASGCGVGSFLILTFKKPEQK